jgi:hypothetical protein
MSAMRWRKLGRIFDPTEHALPDGCVEFAQAPQALVCGDFVRVYFSARAAGPAGKPVSRVAFVDLKPDLSGVARVPRKTVIPLGGLGCFDEHGIFPMNVLQRGAEVHAYTCGWSRRVSVPVETAVGLAVSRDGGLTFERRGNGPVLTASLREPCLVGDGHVREIAGALHMWYIFGLGWKRAAERGTPERVYKIGHAVSDDGLRWVKEEGRAIIADRLDADECQALPAVIEIDGRHHMFFCYRQATDFRKNPDRGYRIGHAWSDDLKNWTRDDENPRLEGSPGEWDSDMQCYPNAFHFGGKVYLLYNGNEFGRRGFGLAVLEK